MQLDDPFPLEELPPPAREIILTEFGGQHPSIRDVASIPNTRWLELPGMGPRLLASMRSLTWGARRNARIPSWAGMADSELQTEFDRLIEQKKAIDSEIKAIRAEIRLRLEVKRIEAKISR
jgi:hypothetical protein